MEIRFRRVNNLMQENEKNKDLIATSVVGAGTIKL